MNSEQSRESALEFQRNKYPYLDVSGRNQCYLLNDEFEVVDLTDKPNLGFEIVRQDPAELQTGSFEGPRKIDFRLSCGEGEGPVLPPVFKNYVPMLAVGSNAAPCQLQRKFRNWRRSSESGDTFYPVFCAAITLRGLAPAYSAHFSPYGAIPLTLAKTGDERQFATSLLFIASELFTAMDESESLGINYCLGLWQDDSSDAMRSKFGVIANWAYVYISRHGYIEIDKQMLIYAPDADAGEPTSTRVVQTQDELRNILFSRMKDEKLPESIDEWHDNAEILKVDPPKSGVAKLERLLEKGPSTVCFTHAIKAYGRDEIPASVTIVSGSNGYAEFADRKRPRQFNFIPSGERTFFRGQLIALVSSKGAESIAGMPRNANSGTCVLTSFHPRARQEVKVVCHLQVEDYDADKVRIYGRGNLARRNRVEPENRLVIRKGRHPDVVYRRYVEEYEEGNLCIAPQSIRGALGYAFDDTEVFCRIEWVEVPPLKRFMDFLGRYLMGWQESYVRVAKLPIEDMEKSIARLQTNVMDILGVQPGYTIIADSVVRLRNKYVLKSRRIKALVCSPEHIASREKSADYAGRLAARYVRSEEVLGIRDVHSILMLDRSLRTDLLQNDEDSSYPDEHPATYLQPLRVRRSNVGIAKKESLVVAFSFLGLLFGVTSLLNQIFSKSPVPNALAGFAVALLLVAGLMLARHRRWPVRSSELKEEA